ncbi:MAG TPA: DUF5615 family PIN-like protein [Rhizomicrobium sp.]|nr:DUF5615 family PIN-like protein [Rhizomicrobium sp.]
MRVLFVCDVHIPPSLAGFLRTQGFEAVHVFEIGLGAADDREIWNYAKEHEGIVVTKDKDFLPLTLSAPIPRLILIRIGNSTNAVLKAKFERLLPNMLKLFEGGGRLVELR